jgi:hypothetical protein
VLRRYSTSIGRKSLSLAAPNCKLCIRGFTLLRRRIKCRWCQDVLCQECCTHKVRSSCLPYPCTRTLTSTQERT